MSIIKEVPTENYKIIDSNVLINGNSIELLSKVQNQQIDFVCIDPPYELENHGGGKGHFGQRKLNRDKHIDFISNGFDIELIFGEVIRVSKVVNLICFCYNKQISKIIKYWENKKYSTTLLVWDKPNPVPFGNGKHVSNLQFMIYVRGKNATFNNIGVNEQKKTFSFPSPSSKKRLHPTEKPIELINRLLRLH